MPPWRRICGPRSSQTPLRAGLPVVGVGDVSDSITWWWFRRIGLDWVGAGSDDVDRCYGPPVVGRRWWRDRTRRCWPRSCPRAKLFVPPTAYGPDTTAVLVDECDPDRFWLGLGKAMRGSWRWPGGIGRPWRGAYPARRDRSRAAGKARPRHHIETALHAPAWAANAARRPRRRRAGLVSSAEPLETAARDAAVAVDDRQAGDPSRRGLCRRTARSWRTRRDGRPRWRGGLARALRRPGQTAGPEPTDRGEDR